MQPCIYFGISLTIIGYNQNFASACNRINAVFLTKISSTSARINIYDSADPYEAASQ